MPKLTGNKQQLQSAKYIYIYLLGICKPIMHLLLDDSKPHSDLLGTKCLFLHEDSLKLDSWAQKELPQVLIMYSTRWYQH